MITRINKQEAIKQAIETHHRNLARMVGEINLHNKIFDSIEPFIQDGTVEFLSVMSESRFVVMRLTNGKKLSDVVESIGPDLVPSFADAKGEKLAITRFRLEMIYEKRTMNVDAVMKNPMFFLYFFKDLHSIRIQFNGAELYGNHLKYDSKEDGFHLEGLEVSFQIGGNSIHYCTDPEKVEDFENLILNGCSQDIHT